jgi:hypothetical protein
MKYRFLLILIVLWFAGLQPLSAENNRYRVEILVLTHLGHTQKPLELRSLEDFSSALDFLQPAEEDAEENADEDADEDAGENAATLPDEVGPAQAPTATEEPLFEDQAASGQTPEELLAEALNAVVPVEEMGPEMQDAWRRLRLSGPFRPLQYLAWEQGSNPPFPILRVHDGEAVLIDDPWAAQRLAEELASAPDAVADGHVNGTPAVPGADEAETMLPDPVVYYRLDGTASLSRSRFLHLAFAIEWREPTFDLSQAPAAALPATSLDPEALPVEPAPSGFLVHRLEQSRPVRSGRMEYFDSPVLGVLAWVTDMGDSINPANAD